MHSYSSPLKEYLRYWRSKMVYRKQNERCNFLHALQQYYRSIAYFSQMSTQTNSAPLELSTNTFSRSLLSCSLSFCIRFINICFFHGGKSLSNCPLIGLSGSLWRLSVLTTWLASSRSCFCFTRLSWVLGPILLTWAALTLSFVSQTFLLFSRDWTSTITLQLSSSNLTRWFIPLILESSLRWDFSFGSLFTSASSNFWLLPWEYANDTKSERDRLPSSNSLRGSSLKRGEIVRARTRRPGDSNDLFHLGEWGMVLPTSNRQMEMCSWMGLHFHDWVDYNGVAFSIGDSGK